MHLVNQRRDSIARKLSRPLLWCGPPELMKLTWERAPDFWSIRALSLRIESDAKRASLPPLWPATWVTDPPERLRAMLDTALRHGDAKNASRVALMLADSLAARGKVDDAIEVLGEVAATPEIDLARAITDAKRGVDAEARLDAPTTPELEASRRMALANVRRAREPSTAKSEYEAARDLFAAAGDRVNEALATANLGVLALASGDVDDAIAELERAEDAIHAQGDARSEAEILSRLGGALLAQRDARRASACVEEALVAFREAGDRGGECRALLLVARAYFELGDAEKARDDATRAVTIAKTLGDDAAALEATALRDAAIAAV
jgi:tetratricopeptide (TPR) repeat protein